MVGSREKRAETRAGSKRKDGHVAELAVEGSCDDRNIKMFSKAKRAGHVYRSDD